MSTAASAPITFIVRGQPQAGAGATRGTGSATGAAFGGRGQTVQRVQVGATRGSSDAVRLTARPGLDAVVLHISNGPSLMLHPETARDLMLAQSGLTRSGMAAQARSRSSGSATTEVQVPAQLGWQGLEQAGASRSATRGRLGDVLLSAIEVVTGLLLEPASRITAAKIGARVDDQVDAGLYALSAQAFAAPLKGNGKPLAKIPPAANPDEPVLVLLHGTFSNTHGTFGKLWQHHPHRVRELFARHGDRVYGFDHPTLLASPIDNALMLARALPSGARLHLLTHSRGGLVAEVLARVCAKPELDEKSLAPFKGAAHRHQLQALRELAAEVKGRNIRVDRVVRVACPARGTLLASKRLDAYVSVLKWSLELAAIPVAPTLIDFIGEVASQRTDPALLPGLECMMPESPLVQWLHTSEGTDAGPLPGQLRVVAGDIQGDSITSWVKTLLADAFYWTDNDFVVQTRSMYGGAPRSPAGGHASATFVLERGGKVSHFSYFSEPGTAEAICNALVQETPAGFRPIGPMSWAGSSSDGLRGMPRAAGTPSASERPAVILLPGILGSHLAVDGKRIWLSMRILGGLGRLAYPDSGGRVLPDGAIGSVYDDLASFLSATHEVIEFSFDWRRPIEEEAARLAEVMDQALTARSTSGQPVRLLAHSMGGVVARTVQLERPAVWQRWLERPGSRLLMLGTPNGGSFAPMQVLSGDDTMGNALAAFGLPFQDHKARRLMAAMPGFLQLQSGLLDPALGLAQSERWQALADQDMKALEEANFWHDPGSQRAIYRWGVPAQDVLDRAVALRRRLDQQRDSALPGFCDRLVMVVGHARFTPAGFEVDAREGLVYLDQPEGGDGRVTLDNALLPGVRAWRVDSSHGDLPDVEGAFPAYLELLQHGETQRLPLVGATGLRSGGAATSALVRNRPSRQRSVVVVPPSGLTELLAPVTEPSTATEPPHKVLRISVHNTNLKFTSQPLMVGHYFASTLSGTEAVVDRFIGGAMSASLAAGLYPEAPGTHQIFINNRQDPDSPLSLPRPPNVVVVGLGSEGKLKSGSITHTVRQATLAWAQRVAEAAGGGPSQFELSATLIGSGGSGISVSTSAQALAQGVREANERLDAGGWPQVGHLHIVELYLDRATDAWGALKLLCAAAPDHFVLSPTIRSGVGALRRPLDNGYRGTAYDFISAVTENDETGEPSIVYTLDTQRARAEVRAQATQARLVGELVRRASNDANRDRNIGRTLFQLLVPVEMEASLGGTSELLLELDDGTAAIPWELLDAPDDGRGGPEAPWAIRNKLLRRLRTATFRSQVSDARPDDCVLVIGEPMCDPARYPPLPAARTEAEAVVDALSGQLGFDASRVHSLIAPDDNLGPDAAAVTTALLARRYRIVHIAGHGEPELQRPGKPPLLRGVVLSDDTFLGPREVQAMRVVPELVFLNCCHLAADPEKLLKGGYDRALFAAGVAKQLIRIGVRCVVAAGWAVEDEPANQFATAFYRALLSGQRFMDAVHAGRLAAYNASPLGNTWAAYQCYGDPDWVWQRNEIDTRRAPPPLAKTYGGIASPVALALALETLAVQSATQGAAPESQREKIRYLEARFDSDWGSMGAVAEAYGVAWAAACDIDRALHWYRRAVAANDGSASVKASEQLANLGARQAWSRLQNAVSEGARPAKVKALVEQGRVALTQAVSTLDALVNLSPTVEREGLLGSTWKRMARLETLAARGQPTTARAQAIERMADHYRRAEALALQAGESDLFYPALNLVAAELLVRSTDQRWAGFEAERIQRVRQSLERKRREDPDFWSVVGLPELSVYEALASHTLAQQLPAVLTSFEDMHQRAGTPWMWASVADQLAFVVEHLQGMSRNDQQAAGELLDVLRRYAAP